MDYSPILAKRIKDLCDDHGISVNHLATICGMRQSTIDNIIRGVSTNPKIRTIQTIAQAFGMTVSEFLEIPELQEQGQSRNGNGRKSVR